MRLTEIHQYIYIYILCGNVNPAAAAAEVAV